jgi:hypothetical protein
MHMLSRHVGLVLFLGLVPVPVSAAELKVSIRTDFPGGNVQVVKNEGSVVQLAPDLRGGPAWFYWHFAAEADQAGRVTFVFADAPKVGARGPAISRDGGKSWQWLGADRVKFASSDWAAPKVDSFEFSFTEAKQKVRLAVALPYLQRDLDDFLTKHKANPHLARSILTKTRKGRRPVELLQIGKPGKDVKTVLLTARHHACESMASYVMEGFLRESMAGSPAGVEFRKKYVLYAVPFVDKDGVESGDQGKNRLPHDHNRDYGKDAIYPEITALQELADLRKVQLALDLHDPLIRGDIHEAFHFVGLGVPHIKDNLNEIIAWLKEERPPAVMVPLNLLADPLKPNTVNRKINSHYFALREHAIMAATLEVPYAQPDCPLDAAMARQYGVSLLKAWVRTKFITAAPDSTRGTANHASLVSFRARFLQTYRSKPKEAEDLANAYSNVESAPALFRVESNNLMALLRLHQREFAAALRLCDAVAKDAHATTHQQATAMLQRMQIVCSDPKSTAAKVEACFTDYLRFPYDSDEQQLRILELVRDFYHRNHDFEQSLRFTRKQLAIALQRDKGRLLNRIAALHELLKRPAEAVASRREAIKVLRPQLDPVPQSIFGALLAGELFDALLGVPTTTLEEKKKAARMVIDHKMAPAALKEKVRKALADLEKQ